MSLGLVVLEEKLFTRMRTRTPTPQSDDIMSAKCPLTFFMIMILLSQRTEFPFVGKILRLQSSRLD